MGHGPEHAHHHSHLCRDRLRHPLSGETSAVTRFQCGCVWLGVHCPNDATAEDGLCDWCAPLGSRTDEQLRQNTNVLLSFEGEVLGLGGRGMIHDAPLADGSVDYDGPSACWYENSSRMIVPPRGNRG